MIGAAQPAPRIPDHVERHLSAAGCTLVGRFAEQARIDGRVALRDSVLVFVLVRSRCPRAHRGLPSLTALRQRELRAAAARWLGQHERGGHRLGRLRFDQVTQTLDHQGRLVALEHLESVF